MNYQSITMITSKKTRLVVSAAVIAIFALIAFIVVTLLGLRAKQITLSAEPFSIRQDSKALSLAQTAMQHAGYKLEDFVPSSSSYNDDSPDFRRYNFSPSPSSGLSGHPGIHVTLLQQDSNVKVIIRRRK